MHSSVDENAVQNNKLWGCEKNTDEEKKRNIEEIEEEVNEIILWCTVCNYALPSGISPDEHTYSEKHRIEISRVLVQGNITDSVIEINSKADLIIQRENYVKKRLKKIKQLYNSRCLKHEKANIMGKETSGINKNRLQKLSLDLDKCITNIIDYEYAESVLKDTIKLLDQRKEADLHVIRQLKFLPCIMEIVKKV